jgi:hypothetical protein
MSEKPKLPQGGGRNNSQFDILSNFTPLEIASQMAIIKSIEEDGVDIEQLVQASNPNLDSQTTLTQSRQKAIQELNNPFTSEGMNKQNEEIIAMLLVMPPALIISIFGPNSILPTIVAEGTLLAGIYSNVKRNDKKINILTEKNQRQYYRNEYLRTQLQNQIRTAPQIAPAQNQEVKLPIEITVKDKETLE